MRISDWSSDVCSSDLPRRRGRRRQLIAFRPVRLARTGRPTAAGHSPPSAFGAPASPPPKQVGPPAVDPAPPLLLARTLAATTSERKSVVSGKSVSVRVELGGRRILKKKNKKKK